MQQGSMKRFSIKRLSKSFNYVDEWVPYRDLSARSVKFWHSLFPHHCLPCPMKIPFCPSKFLFKVFLFHILWYTQKNLTIAMLLLCEANSYHTDQIISLFPWTLPSNSVLLWVACLLCSSAFPYFQLSLCSSCLAWYSV